MDKKISRHKYPTTASDYLLLEQIGQGVSAIVYRARCIPLNDIVAVKVLDLEKCNSSLDEIRREAQTMRLISHPNILSAYCSFVVDQSLWVVMPFMAGGSCLHIMKSGYPDGFEEPVIATILRECLKGLEYLHSHDLIHRDVKAGNILIDSNGVIKLGDFGVSACMFDTGERQRSRNTFVGTPCWMAPEVMEQLYGYDFRADIWSFGITALELAHGHAPFSKYPPMKVLLMTLQNAPPGLDYERDRKFSKAFKKLIAVCLVKDPSKRPTARKLLKHSFFRHARYNDYIVRTILDGLPPLGQRLRDMKLKEADMIAQNKMPFNAKEERSQNEYKRGVSSWNFDIEDLKAQAALIQDDDEPVTNEDASKNSSDESENLEENIDTDSFRSPDMIHTLKDDNAIEDGEVQNFMEDFKEDKDAKICDSKMDRYPVVENGLINVRKDGKELTNKRDSFLQKLEEREMRSLRLPRDARRSSSGPLLAECVLSSYRGQDEDKDQNRTSIQANGGIFQSGVRGRREHTFSGPMNLKGVVEGLEKGGCIRRGRFSITSEDVDLLEDGSPAPQKTAVRQVEASDRELKLLQQVTNLQQKIDKLEAELEVIKHRNLHLEQQLNLRQNRRVNT